MNDVTIPEPEVGSTIPLTSLGERIGSLTYQGGGIYSGEIQDSDALLLLCWGPTVPVSIEEDR